MNGAGRLAHTLLYCISSILYKATDEMLTISKVPWPLLGGHLGGRIGWRQSGLQRFHLFYAPHRGYSCISTDEQGKEASILLFRWKSIVFNGCYLLISSVSVVMLDSWRGQGCTPEQFQYLYKVFKILNRIHTDNVMDRSLAGIGAVHIYTPLTEMKDSFLQASAQYKP